MSDVSNYDKPFKCANCNQCFANNDHLLVHEKVHQKENLHVKMPGFIVDNIADQTPTPTRFLKTADVEGAQLFEEINPFDQYFKLASKQSSTSILNNNTADVSSTEITSTFPVVDTTNLVSSNRTTTPLESSITPSSSSIKKNTVVKKTPLVSSTTTPHQISVKLPVSQIIEQTAALSTVTSTLKPERKSVVSISQTVLKQIKNQQTTSAQELVVPRESQSQLPQDTYQHNQQEVIREQLASLISSGQIKIQFTSDPSSPKVQATIVGTFTKTSTGNSASSPAANQETKLQVVRTIGTNASHLSTFTQVASSVTPMSIFSTNAALPNVPLLPNSLNNLANAKQKLKESIQQQSTCDNNNSMNNRVTMVHSSSHQGKYKDIILTNELTHNLSGENCLTNKRKNNDDESSPDEKRKRFLERNRAAASRCRQKRKIWVNQLEKKSDDLQTTNSQLVNEITSLRAEVAQLKGLLIAHKDCPVTLQQKALLGQIGTSTGAYMAVSSGQIIAINHDITSNNFMHPSAAEEVATSALTDMADRVATESTNHVSSGTVTIKAITSSLLT